MLCFKVQSIIFL